MRVKMLFVFSYRLRVECMLLKAEFEANMSFLEPSIEAMLTAGEGINNHNQINLLLTILISLKNLRFRFMFRYASFCLS